MEINELSDRFLEEENLSVNLTDSSLNVTSIDIEQLKTSKDPMPDPLKPKILFISKDWRKSDKLSPVQD